MFLHIFQTYLVDCLEIRILAGTVRTDGVRNVSMTLNVVTIKIFHSTIFHTLSMTRFFGLFLPSPSDCKMMSLLLNSMTSLLLILTAIHQPPSSQVAVVLNVWDSLSKGFLKSELFYILTLVYGS